MLKLLMTHRGRPASDDCCWLRNSLKSALGPGPRATATASASSSEPPPPPPQTDYEAPRSNHRRDERRAARAVLALPCARVLNDTSVHVIRDQHDRLGSVLRAWTSSQCATLGVTMLPVNVDRDDAALLHEQVAAEIRRAIADGEAGPGERLPPARHLQSRDSGRSDESSPKD